MSGYTFRIGSLVPVRTCVGCGRRGNQSDLLRITARGSELILGGRGREPGRGAYLHPNPECLALAERRRVWARALRATGPFSAEVLRQDIAAEADRRSSEAGDEMSNR